MTTEIDYRARQLRAVSKDGTINPNIGIGYLAPTELQIAKGRNWITWQRPEIGYISLSRALDAMHLARGEELPALSLQDLAWCYGS